MGRKVEVYGLALLSCMAALLPMVIPVGGLFMATFAPFPLIILSIKYPWHYVLGLIGIQGVILCGLGEVSPILFLSQYALVPLTMAEAIRRGYHASQTIVVSVVFPLGCGAVLLGLLSLATWQAPRTLLMPYVEPLAALFQEQLLTPDSSEDAAQLAAFRDSLPQLLLTMFPALLAINHLFTNVFSYLLVRYYCRRRHLPLAFEPPDLTLWSASDYLVWFFLASGVALLIPFSLLSTLGLNVLLVTLAVYLLQGLAIAVFWGRKLPLSRSFRWLLALTTFLLAGPLCLAVCTAAGLFDLWVDFRRQRRGQLMA